MPKGFEDCRANSGRIRTVSGPNKQMGLNKNQYAHICVLNGKVHRGEVKTKEKE